MGENKTTLDTLLGFEAGMKEANDLLRPGDILPATADRPECVVVPAADYERLKWLVGECEAARKALFDETRALRAALQEQEKADG